MSLSVFSFLMAVLWCNIFIIFLSIMRKQTGFIAHFSVAPLLLFLGVCLFRLCFVFELPNAIVIQSQYMFPAIIDGLTMGIFSIMGYELSILDILLFLWIAGAVFFVVKYVIEAKRLKNILRMKTVLKNQCAIKIMNEVLSHSKKKPKVELVELAGIPSPMVSGYFHPTIYLPAIPFTEDELRCILLHELTHFLNKDAWIKLFMHFICVIFWWNPMVHILKGNLVHILELRCDAKLISQLSEEEKFKYLESITMVLRYQLSSRQALQPTMDVATTSVLVNAGQMSNVEQRFHLILEKDYAKKYQPMVYGVYFLITMLFLVSNLFVIQPVFSCEDQETYAITPTAAYLLDNHDGTYSLYVNEEFVSVIGEEYLLNEPFTSLPVK
ncbi:M56 family metallopeptidase [Anaerotignum sp.]|uniref:M56 family metallopeptidase n=1 Tax=Anaerotignum sp. TaxID=2039241 RepID=UPI0028986EB1|nr:M56 family metallopeptidase [Anaerotignum sp.]